MAGNGGMVRLARHLKGFHQTEAAAQLGIEHPLLSRVENGLVEAREEMLLRAETVYELPRSFFALTDPVFGAPVSVHPMWRGTADRSLPQVGARVDEVRSR